VHTHNYRLGGILGSMGHKVKTHKITPATGKERGELEITDYVVLQKPQEEVDRLPPLTLILDFTMTHPRYGRLHVYPSGQLTNIRRSDGSPEPDGDIKVVVRKNIIHYRQVYIDPSEPITFMSPITRPFWELKCTIVTCTNPV
jgi:hypothetical protein